MSTANLLAVHAYATVLVLLTAMIGFVTVVLVLSHLIGPKRRGLVKDDTYESGMESIGDARRRFNVRFYIVAMMFLLFDVEIVLLWPWALAWYDVAVRGQPADAIGMSSAMAAGALAVFFVILVVGYLYDLGKGVFRWT